MFLIPLVLFFTSAFAQFDWQGHRGARGLYPENTIGAMKEAIKYPINTLEMDVVISKDGQVVVSHEPWMEEEICLDPHGQSIKGKGFNLFKLTYDEIKQFDCGSKKHLRFVEQTKEKTHKPLLKELIQEIELMTAGRPLNYSIEIKSTPVDEKMGYQPHYEDFSKKVIELLSVIPSNRLMIQSFDSRVLQFIHDKYPTIQLVALKDMHYDANAVIKELGFKPTVFSPDWTLLTDADVKFFKAQGIKVIPWTVNSVEDMQKMIKMGVDGIITDYPNLITEASGKCKTGQSLFEGACVKIPTHALPIAHNPGWRCKFGYIQKRNRCLKVKIPTHADLTDDGKNWNCKEGYVKYRLKCNKAK